MNQFLSGVDRAQIVRWTAIYLLIYAIINACGGLLLGIAGGLAAGAGAITGATLPGTDAGAASTQLVGIGVFGVILAILWLISVPVFAVAAFGLFRRKSWARMGAVIALGFSILLSVLNLGNGITGIIWIIISAFAIYLFWSDEGIKQVLSE
jgi:hypothetical protein